MKYDSAGITYDFSSEGLFDIAAFRNQETAFLKPGKKMKVDLLSIDDTACYNFYKLDTAANKWKYRSTEISVAPKMPTKKK